MDTIGQNIINEIKSIKREFFTKEEVIQLINKIRSENQLPIVECDNIIVNPETRTVTIENKETLLPKKLFDLLYYFISNKNKMLTRDKILNDVWGSDVCVIERTIDVHVRKLRKLLPKNYIKTNKNVGYIWEEKF